MSAIPVRPGRQSVTGKRKSTSAPEKESAHIRLTPLEVKREKANFDRIDVNKVRW